MTNDAPKVLVAVSGSIAAYRCVDFIRELLLKNYEVEVILSDAAKQFVGSASVETFLGKRCLSNKVFDELHLGTDHIRWARWADLVLLYGATANRLAQISHGFADDMLSLQLLAFKGKVLVAPAMNPAMWEHPAVTDNCRRLKDRGYIFSGPISGTVACGETGVGHLQAHAQILVDLEDLLATGHNSSTGKKVLISAGPMKSSLDPVRFFQNSSSGITGLHLAQEFSNKGSDVTCLLGPMDSNLRQKYSMFKCIDYSSVSDYREALDQSFPKCDLFVSAAAVLDFEFETRSDKLSYNKKDTTIELQLRPVEDFVASLSRVKKDHQKIVAFALQTGESQQQLRDARLKLETKGCDAIVLNSAQKGVGPNASDGIYKILLKGKSDVLDLGLQSKSSFAKSLVEQLEQNFIL